MREDLMDVFKRHEATKQEADPRPDVTEDHALWCYVLAEARRIDPDPQGLHSLYGLLHGLRCGGSHLQWKQGHLWLDYRALLETWNDTALRRDWLMPQAQNMKAVFRAVESLARPKSGTKLD